MIKNLLLSIVLVFAGLAAFTIVVSLVSWLIAYIDYRKETYKIRLNEMRNPKEKPSLLEEMFGIKPDRPQRTKED